MRNLQKLITILPVALLLIITSCGQVPSSISLDSSGYGHTTLSNGIKVLVNHDNTTSLTSGRILFAGGVLTETTENNGITYLTTKMLLKGNQTMNAAELNEELDFLGANISINCFRDYSTLSFTTLTENFEKVLELISQSLKNPTFPEEELAKLKFETVGNIKASNDNQSQASSKLFWRTAYGDQGYGLPMLGTEESVKKITADDLRNHFNTYYGGSNIIFAVATDYPITQLTSLIQKHFDSIKADAQPIPKPSLNVQDEKVGFVSFDRNQSFIYMGNTFDHVSREEAPFLVILNEIMGAGVSSRLWFLRQKEKLAYAVYTQYYTDKFCSGFRAAIGTDTSKVHIALASLEREWDKLVKDGISETELTDAKINMKNSLIFRIDRKSNRANYMAYYDYMGYGYRYALDMIEMADNITVNQINHFLQENFTKDRRFTSVVGKM